MRSLYMAGGMVLVVGVSGAVAEELPSLTFPESSVLVEGTVFRGLNPNRDLVVRRAIEETYRLPLSGLFSRSQIQEQLDGLYDTGWLAAIEVTLESVGGGSYRLVYDLEINPEIERVEVAGVTLPPIDFTSGLFGDMPTGLVNNRELAKRVVILEDWYQRRGYNLARVARQSVVGRSLLVEVVEGQLADVDFQFFDDRGRRINGRTNLSVILREMSLLPGQIYNISLANRDLQRLTNFEIFSNVRPQLIPDADDPRRYVLRYFIFERRSRRLDIGANAVPGIGPGMNLTYSDRNFAGLRQNLSLDLQYSGNSEFSGRFRFANPWIGTNPLRLGFGVGAFYELSGVNALDGGQLFIPTELGGQAITRRLGSSLDFPFRLPNSRWFLIPRLNLSQVTVLSSSNRQGVATDILGNPFTVSGTPSDFLATLGFRAVRDTRDSDFVATRGSLLDLNFQQALGFDGINFGRLAVDASLYFTTPGVQWGGRPGAFVLGGSAGLTYGNLPPYEAFVLGGMGTVRGWAMSDIASAKNYILGTLEYRFPLPLNLYGVAFFDIASDLGSQGSVIGRPGVVRDKPGFGLGYGLGLRFLDQRIGIDWGLNNLGTSEVTFNANFRF